METIELHIGLQSPDRCYLRPSAYVKGLLDFPSRPKGFTWDSTLRCWTFPPQKMHIDALKEQYGEKVVFDPSFSLWELCREIRIRQMSRHTLGAYFQYNRDLLHFAKKYPHQLTDEDIRLFIEHLAVTKKSAPATVSLAIDAIKFYLCGIMKMKLYFSPRPQKGVRLPSVLSSEEVKRLFEVTINLKHKAILMTAYSAGLRVSETANLRVSDIDFDRMLIRVRQGKGKKDRYTVLSARAALVLKEYIERYRPQHWLFAGQKTGERLAIRSLQHVFEDSMRRAGISKDVSFHGLRHSFATHLLENGIDIRYIKELLGHRSLRTTEIYTHVRQHKLESIRSPLDMI